MPYVDHVGVKTPSNSIAPIWRYFDLPKLVSLLVTRSLYFSQLALLGDRFEGTVTRLTIEAERAHYEQIKDIAPPGQYTPQDTRANRRNFRERVFVNCWHQNERESAAMWDLYGSRGLGVAIQSTIPRLIQAVDKFSGLSYVGEVTYLDYELDALSRASTFTPALTKRRSYEHEHEVRALLLDRARDSTAIDATEYVAGDRDGIYLPVELSELALGIYIAPESRLWYRDAVVGLLKEFGHGQIPWRQSALDSEPIY